MGSFTTISSISQANPAVVTATHGFSTGDIILITNVSEMAQINTIRFQITVLDGNSFELDGLDSSGFAAAGTGGVARRVPKPRSWEPIGLVPLAITQAVQAVVTTNIDHGYKVGQMVALRVPKDFGMVQANGAIADVLAVTSNTMTLNLDSLSFDPFRFPASGSPLGIPSMSNYGTRGSLILNPYRRV
jgi:hypothetical protein